LAKNEAKLINLSSFRDPDNFVLIGDDFVFRVYLGSGHKALETLLTSPLYAELVSSGSILPIAKTSYGDLDEKSKVDLINRLPDLSPGAIAELAIFKSPKLTLITYPYEWTNQTLKEAALHTLHIREKLLSIGLDLKDASAFNIQFQGLRPVFIDVGSIIEISKTFVWPGYRQFFEHFLNPLLAIDRLSVDSALIWRINWLTGLPSKKMPSILAFRTKVRPRYFLLNLASLPSGRGENVNTQTSKTRESNLRLKDCIKFHNKLNQRLRREVMRIKQKDLNTQWAKYGGREHYTNAEIALKIDSVLSSVGEFSNSNSYVLDVGGNDGKFAFPLASKGVTSIVLDSDPQALENGVSWAKSLDDSMQRCIFFLNVDFLNSTPSVGLFESERISFTERFKNPELIVCFAVIHHMVISQSVPVRLVIENFRRFNCPLLIEIPSEDDPKVKLLMRGKAGLQPQEYSVSQIRLELERQFGHVSYLGTTSTHRELFHATP